MENETKIGQGMYSDGVVFTMDLDFYVEGKWAANQALGRLKGEYPVEGMFTVKFDENPDFEKFTDAERNIYCAINNLWLGNFQWFMDHHAAYLKTNHCMASLRAGQQYVFANALGYDKDGVFEWFDRSGEVISVEDFLIKHKVKTGSGINWGNFSGMPEELVDAFKLVCKESNTRYDITKRPDGTYGGRWHY